MSTIDLPVVHWPRLCLPRVTVAGRYPIAAGTGDRVFMDTTLAMHLHDYAGALRIGTHRFDLRPGDFTLTPATTGSSYALPVGGKHLCVHLAMPPGPSDETVPLPMHLRLHAEAASVAERMWTIIMLHRGGTRDPRLADAASAAAQALLLWLAAHATLIPSSPSRSGRALDQLVRIIESDYSTAWTVATLARAVRLDPAYLAARFHERFGMTILRYLLARRMDVARHLLLRTNEPVQAIGRRVGIGDPQYFNKQFRRAHGMSPTRFRAQLRDR